MCVWGRIALKGGCEMKKLVPIVLVGAYFGLWLYFVLTANRDS